MHLIQVRAHTQRSGHSLSIAYAVESLLDQDRSEAKPAKRSKHRQSPVKIRKVVATSTPLNVIVLVSRT